MRWYSQKRVQNGAKARDAAAGEDRVASCVLSTLAEIGIEPDELTLRAHLVDDLDLDSLDWADLVLRLEDATGVTLEDEALGSVATVGDLVERIRAARAKRRR